MAYNRPPSGYRPSYDASNQQDRYDPRASFYNTSFYDYNARSPYQDQHSSEHQYHPSYYGGWSAQRPPPVDFSRPSPSHFAAGGGGSHIRFDSYGSQQQQRDGSSGWGGHQQQSQNSRRYDENSSYYARRRDYLQEPHYAYSHQQPQPFPDQSHASSTQGPASYGSSSYPSSSAGYDSWGRPSTYDSGPGAYEQQHQHQPQPPMRAYSLSRQPNWPDHRSQQQSDKSQQQHSRPSPQRSRQSNSPRQGGLPPSPRKPRRMKPTAEYEELMVKPSLRLETPTVTKKLLLLDLNGTLLCRPKTQNLQSFRRRPYVGALLEYLAQAWEVGVWSSAQPGNVASMTKELGLGSEKNPIIIQWARDTLGLSREEYNQKSVTIKDLDVIFAHLNKQPASSSRIEPYSPRNTLLLDDSHIKTSCQPYNHLPVPDFTLALSVTSARALLDGIPNASNPDEITIEEDEDEGGADAILSVADETPILVETFELDRSLLGVVGILERARGEESLVGWVHSGGLVPDLDDPEGWAAQVSAEESEEKPSSVAANDKKKKVHKKKARRAAERAGPALSLSSPLPPTSSSSSSLSSSPTNEPPITSLTPWYTSPRHLAFWTARGVAELERRGIAVEHSMDLTFLDQLGFGRPRSEQEDRKRAEAKERRRTERANARSRSREPQA